MSQLDNTHYNQGPNETLYTFAGYPSIKIYKSETGNAWVNHLLFGDYIRIKSLDIVKRTGESQKP